MVAVHNEVDVLEQNVNWYYEQGFESVVVANNSTDGSTEIGERALRDRKLSGLRTLQTDGCEWDLILSALFELAKSKQLDCFMLSTPDEFFETGDGSELYRTMASDIANGCNLIKFFNMEFWMTPLDPENEPSGSNQLPDYPRQARITCALTAIAKNV